MNQNGGAPKVEYPVVKEIIEMFGHFLLLFLVLVCVYSPRIPDSVVRMFRKWWVQVLSILAIMTVTNCYGYVHGVLAALAFSLILSHSLHEPEGFQDGCNVPILLSDTDTMVFIPKTHRWFGEKILGEHPVAIREDRVNTSAVQDLSERTMGTGSSNVSR